MFDTISGRFDTISSPVFLSNALTRLCWFRCTLQTEWPSSFAMWTCPTEEIWFQLPQLCFPALPVPEFKMCKLFKIHSSSRNVRCLKFCIGLWKWMSNFKEQKGTYFWNFRDPRLHCPAIWTARILEVLYIMSLKNFALQANYLILLSSNLNHVSMFDYFCWMYTVFFLRQIFGDFICSGISWSKLQDTRDCYFPFSTCV